MSKITCFGEVLWDIFPSHKKIGGAPLNVALRLRSLGNDVSMISCVGDDLNGREIQDYISLNGLNVESVQITNAFKTSEVKVIMDNAGSATYNIEFPCAWDNIHLNDKLFESVKSSEVFIFGSLAARNHVSRNTLTRLLNVAKYKVFDVNLRAPHYTVEVLEELMLKADFIKFNDDELFLICRSLGFNSNNVEANIEFISKTTGTKTICVTLGAHGAILFIGDAYFSNKGYNVDVKDTVGAGDSFLASLIHKLISNSANQEAIDFACAIGAIVASKKGATPKIAKKEWTKVINQ